MDSGMKNKVALLTGSSQGIARAAAEAFAAEGAKLAICARNHDRLKQVADQLGGRYQVEVLAEKLDVTDFAGMREFVRRVGEHFGRIDICVANSGALRRRTFFPSNSKNGERILISSSSVSRTSRKL